MPTYERAVSVNKALPALCGVLWAHPTRSDSCQ